MISWVWRTLTEASLLEWCAQDDDTTVCVWGGCPLASGTSIRALINLVQQANATLVGIAALVEKRFEVRESSHAHAHPCASVTPVPFRLSAPLGWSCASLPTHQGAYCVSGDDRGYGRRHYHLCGGPPKRVMANNGTNFVVAVVVWP